MILRLICKGCGRYQVPCIGRGVERSLCTYIKGLGGVILAFICKGEC